jgi:hypothetical protein
MVQPMWKPVLRTTSLLAVLAAVLVGGPLAPAARAAAGCDAAHPTWIGGLIAGYPDNRAVNAQIGVVVTDSSGASVDSDGHRYGTAGAHFCGLYSWCDFVNKSIAVTGSTDPNADYDWGACVAANVTAMHAEVYPKINVSWYAVRTDFTRYGAAAHYGQAITKGATNTIALRLPVHYEADRASGQTGSIVGYVKFRGKAVAASRITRVRAFSTGKGPQCGIEGFAPGATKLAVQSVGTYFQVSYLVAGRCGQSNQRYWLSVDCTCDGVHKRSVSLLVYVYRGKATRQDVLFA